MNIVTCKEKETFLSKDYKTTEAEQARSGLKVHPYKTGNFSTALLDLGSKKNIAGCLLKRGCDVTVYPAFTKAEDIIMDNPDGIILSNGPGDPKEYVDIIKEVKKLYDSNIPIFAICLGHQLMALANGGDTRKMKYGHRGANHPVKDLKTGRVYISTQNHGYVVEGESLSDSIVEPSFINVNDKTIEGLHYLGKNIFTVQFHPEASSGPQDTEFLFDEFIQMMEVSK
jgi:carbamoyl-phosphate synthase small subunit